LNIERNVAISILKLTKSGPVKQQLINIEAKIPKEDARKLLQRLQNDGLIYLHRDVIDANATQRLRLAVYAMKLGADLEQTSSFLQWQEFEGMAAFALEQNGYNILRNMRFKYGGRKWEIDIVGCKKPFAICVDCKHWHHGLYPSTLRRIVEEQVERTQALAKSQPNPAIKIEFASWEKAKLVPVVLSLVVGALKFHDDVPIVPVLQLQDFLVQLPLYAGSLKNVLWLSQDVQNRLF